MSKSRKRLNFSINFKKNGHQTTNSYKPSKAVIIFLSLLAFYIVWGLILLLISPNYNIVDPVIWTLNFILLPFGRHLDSFHSGITTILRGLGNGAIITVQISVFAIFFGFFIAILLASILSSKSKLYGIKPIAQFYVDFFRSTPLLVQILLVYFSLPAIWPNLSTWIRDIGGNFELVAGTIGLTLNTSAYQAEIVRSGIQAIPSGQTEAARALGMSPTQTMIFVILPQAIRIIIPPMTNEVITLILNSSLVSAIGVLDITKRSQSLLSFYYAWWVFLIAALYYFLMSYAISKIAKMIEMKFKIPGLGTTNE